jgi:hypothetical protein
VAQATGQAGVTENYRALPLGKLITETAATLVCGGPKVFKSQEQERLNELVRENRLGQKVQSAAESMSAAGGVYLRAYVNQSTPRGSRVPLIELRQETSAIPVVANQDELLQVTFVDAATAGERRVLRLFTTHTLGAISYQCWLGTSTTQGDQVDLSEWAAVAPGWEASGMEWEEPTAPGALCAVYIPNGTSPWPYWGQADLDGLEDLLLAANRSLMTGSDAYDAAAPIVLADPAILDSRGNLPGAGVKVVKADMSAGAGEIGPPLKVEQGRPEVQGHIDWQDHLIDQALTMAGISPASLGRGIEGAVSGTALRLRMYQSLAAAALKRESLEQGVAEILRDAQLLDQAYFSQSYADANELPTVVLSDGLPTDHLEQAQIASTLRREGLASQAEALRIARPDLEEEAIQDELTAIQGERTAQVQDVRSITLEDLDQLS